MTTQIEQTPEQFFYEHAGWSYGKDETSEQGRMRCAAQLAKAEADGSKLGYSFEWDEDDTNSSEFSDEEPFYPLWYCVARDVNGKVIGSLGGIDFGRDKSPWGEPYRRVVEAELASEALP